MFKFKLILLASVMALTSCEKAYLEESADPNNPVEIFEECWRIYNAQYAMFEFKNVNWQAMYDLNRPLVNENTTNEELFEILGDMILTLRDGHSSLSDEVRDTTKSFDILKGAPRNLDFSSLYLQILGHSGIEYDMAATLGKNGINGSYMILKGNIGYLAFDSFGGILSNSDLDVVFSYFNNTKGLIIDLRDNTGGDLGIASNLAKHFATGNHFIGTTREKNGPNPNDFTEIKNYIIPLGGEVYSNPVMVLTNGKTFSASTYFIAHLNPLDHVTFIGSRTGGGSGFFTDGLLSNGWLYTVCRSEFIDFRGVNLDDGFDPDIEVWLDESVPHIDEVLQRAIDELN